MSPPEPLLTLLLFLPTQPTLNQVYTRRIDPSVLAFSLSLYQSICILFSSRFTSYNKQLRNFVFLSHIKRRTNDDRFPLSIWEVWFCSNLGVPDPVLIGPSQRCVVTLFIMIRMEIIFRHWYDVKLNHRVSVFTGS